ncbi:hypothetical protein WSM22_43050 [Cytophagales bacterium WSM2-2]|nr:hypothetical protein WSM22_43050 [Cytophagales bacterium WSM2-2]
MKRFFVVCVLAVVCVVMTSCPPGPGDGLLIGTWSKLIDFEGDPRSGAVAFVINGYAYVGTGYNAKSSSSLRDFWRFDPMNSTWEKVSDLPGAPRVYAVAFALNGKGYVGTGTTDNFTGLSDFYEFSPDAVDPITNSIGTWRKIANFPGERYGAVAFTIKNRAFVGTGTDAKDNTYSDIWEYDATANQWIKRNSIIGSKRAYSFVMTINDYVYIGGGVSEGSVIPDFARFDINVLGSGQPWTALNPLTGKNAGGSPIPQPSARSLASAFSIGNFGYLSCGSYSNISGASSDTWQYDPLNDSWKKCSSFSDSTPYKGAPRNSAVAFTIDTPSGTLGYVATGGTSGLRLEDLWVFNPIGN